MKAVRSESGKVGGGSHSGPGSGLQAQSVAVGMERKGASEGCQEVIDGTCGRWAVGSEVEEESSFWEGGRATSGMGMQEEEQFLGKILGEISLGLTQEVVETCGCSQGQSGRGPALGRGGWDLTHRGQSCGRCWAPRGSCLSPDPSGQTHLSPARTPQRGSCVRVSL